MLSNRDIKRIGRAVRKVESMTGGEDEWIDPPVPFLFPWKSELVFGLQQTAQNKIKVLNCKARKYNDGLSAYDYYTHDDTEITFLSNGAGQKICWRWTKNAGPLEIIETPQTADPTDDETYLTGIIAIFDVTDGFAQLATGGAIQCGNVIDLDTSGGVTEGDSDESEEYIPVQRSIHTRTDGRLEIYDFSNGGSASIEGDCIVSRRYDAGLSQFVTVITSDVQHASTASSLTTEGVSALIDIIEEEGVFWITGDTAEDNTTSLKGALIQDNSSVDAIDIGARVLCDTGGTDSGNFNARELYDGSEAATVAWGSGALKWASKIIFDWAAGELNDSDARLSLSVDARTAYDYYNTNTTQALSWGRDARKLFDNTGEISLNWHAREASDGTGSNDDYKALSWGHDARMLFDNVARLSVDWHAREASDGESTPKKALSWGKDARKLFDNSANVSVDWHERELRNAAGTLVAQWGIGTDSLWLNVVGGYQVDTTPGVTASYTLVQAGGAGDVTLTVTGGIVTAYAP